MTIAQAFGQEEPCINPPQGQISSHLSCNESSFRKINVYQHQQEQLVCSIGKTPARTTGLRWQRSERSGHRNLVSPRPACPVERRGPPDSDVISFLPTCPPLLFLFSFHFPFVLHQNGPRATCETEDSAVRGLSSSKRPFERRRLQISARLHKPSSSSNRRLIENR